jgi:hypothetical protein
MKKSMNGIFA